MISFFSLHESTFKYPVDNKSALVHRSWNGATSNKRLTVITQSNGEAVHWHTYDSPRSDQASYCYSCFTFFPVNFGGLSPRPTTVLLYDERSPSLHELDSLRHCGWTWGTRCHGTLPTSNHNGHTVERSRGYRAHNARRSNKKGAWREYPGAPTKPLERWQEMSDPANSGLSFRTEGRAVGL